MIYDIEAALYHAVRLLKPGGVLLANFGVWTTIYTGVGHGDRFKGARRSICTSFTPIQVHNPLHRLAITGDTTRCRSMATDGVWRFCSTCRRMS